MLSKFASKTEDSAVSRSNKTIVLTISGMVNTLLSVISSMIAARYLSMTEIAVNSQTFLAYTTFSPFILLGITTGIYYYLSQNEHRKRAVVYESLLVVLFTSFMFSLFIVFGGNELLAKSFKNSALSYTLYFMIPYVMLSAPAAIMEKVFVNENRLRFNAAFSVIQTFVVLIGSFIAMWVFRTGSAMVIARVVISCACSIFACIVGLTIIPHDNAKMELSSIKRLLIISVPVGFSSILSALSRSLDKWIISTMLTPTLYAIYSHGAYELPFISSITAAVNTVLLVDLTKAAKEKRYNTAVELFRMAAEKTAMFLIPIMVFAMVVGHDIIIFLFTDAYIDAVPIFQIYLLYIPIDMVCYGPFLVALGKSRFMLLKTATSLIINAVLSVVFVYFMNSSGAAIATIISLYCFNVPLNLHIISKETGIKWKNLLPFKRIIHYILFALPGACCSYIVMLLCASSMPTLVALILEFSSFVAITCPLYIWKFKLNIMDIIHQFLGMIKGKQAKK